METDYKSKVTMDPSGFVLLADYVPSIIQEIRYYSTYNFIGDKIDGYEQPCAIITKEAARALKTVSNELNVQGYRMKVFDCYRPACGDPCPTCASWARPREGCFPPHSMHFHHVQNSAYDVFVI